MDTDNLYEEWLEKGQGRFLSRWYKDQVAKGRRDRAVEKIIELDNWMWGAAFVVAIIFLILGLLSLRN